MKKSLKDSIKIHFVALVSVLLMTVAFSTSWLLYYAQHVVSPYYFKGDILIIVLFAFIYGKCAQLYDAFKLSISRITELAYSEILASIISDVLAYGIIILLSKRIPHVLPMMLTLAAQILFAFFWALLAHKWYFLVHPPKRTVIVWDVRKGLRPLIKTYGLEKRYNIVATPHVKECLANIETCLAGAEAVFLYGIHSADRNKIIKYCVQSDIDSYVIPRVGDVIMSGARSIHMFHLPFLKLERYNPTPEYLFFKRFFDIMLSLLALIVLSPLMIIIAIIIKCTDGETVFYRQTRLTLDGKKFDVLKFRSMRMDAEKDGVARLSTGDKDPRITPIGRFIRACRIDELPQLLNILAGDMAIVGPRPERPEISQQYEQEMPEFSLRLQAKAGLTGYAQVYGKYNTTPYDKLLMDLTYIAKPSLAEDFKICLATVKILFMPESTEGVAVGATTAMDYENVADSTENDAETVTK